MINTMKLRTLALVVAIIFLITHSGCASLSKNQMQTTNAYSEFPVDDFNTQMKKDTREWLFVALIVLGIAIALGATISASSSGGGFSMGIHH
jgi:hypothetical protein